MFKLLHETGIPFEGITDIFEPNTRTLSQEFTAINPKKRVPTLSINGEIITETPAIMMAISQLAQEKQFSGKTPLEHVRVQEWLDWLAGTLHGQGYGGVFRPERYSDDSTAWNGIKEKALKHIKDCYEMIEERLTGLHAVGNTFTAVDPYLLVFYRWGKKELGFKMDQYVKYTALISNLVERPAVKATLKTENIDSTL